MAMQMIFARFFFQFMLNPEKRIENWGGVEEIFEI
jgi:hypothetical protein